MWHLTMFYHICQYGNTLEIYDRINGNKICYVHWWPGNPGLNTKLSHTKNSKKWYLIPTCLKLSIVRYGSRVKWSNTGKVAVHEKGVFVSPLTTFANLLLWLAIGSELTEIVTTWRWIIILLTQTEWNNINKNIIYIEYALDLKGKIDAQKVSAMAGIWMFLVVQ